MPFPSFPSGGSPPKLLVPLIAVIAVIGGGAVYLGKVKQVTQLEQMVVQARQQLEELNRQSDALKQKLSAAESSRKSLDDSNSSLRKELASVNTDRDRFRAELDDWKDRYAALEQNKASLEQQVAGITDERDAAKKDAERVTSEKSDLERATMRLRERLTLLDRDYRQLSDQLAKLQAIPNAGVNSISVASAAGPVSAYAPSAAAPPRGSLSPGTVELPPIIVRKDQAGMSMPVRGRLVEVNDPHQFIVVDKGSQDGVHVGMVFNILRGSTTVGKVTVVRVRPQLSACDLLRAKTPGPLQVGDQAVQAGS